MHTIVQRMVGACHQVTAHQWVALLLARLAIGFFFVMSGYNKLCVQGIGALREEFVGYGIPLPWLSASIDALVQFIGGVGRPGHPPVVPPGRLCHAGGVGGGDHPRRPAQRHPGGPAWAAVLGVVLLPAGTHLSHGLALVDLSRPGQGQSGSGDCPQARHGPGATPQAMRGGSGEGAENSS